MTYRHKTDDRYLTREGAYRLATTIENYWTGRGYYGLEVEVSVFKAFNDHHPLFMLRSNMVNGLPPKGRVI